MAIGASRTKPDFPIKPTNTFLMSYTPRPSQEPILAYRSGKMGVSAVPGSGKTWSLSQLAIQLLQENILQEGQELLIVTLTNSAANHFKARLDAWARINPTHSLIPRYRVSTLHSLAYDILRERPALANLEPDFIILDELVCNSIINRISKQFTLNYFPAIEPLIKDHVLNQTDNLKSKWLPELIADIGIRCIRTAKDKRHLPEQLLSLYRQSGMQSIWLEIGLQVYLEYRQAAAYHAGIDFDDLIRLAIEVLDQDQEYLNQLQYRWLYVLEDEAQDSSRLQEEILRKITASHGNWVRVGDPNQAIYETFTTASPKHLINFIQQEDVFSSPLDESSRSCQAIIQLANYLIEWTRTMHPIPAVRDALVPPYIKPVPESDPYPNPPSAPNAVKIMLHQKYSPEEEIRAVAMSLKKWLPLHPESTVAVLAFSNAHAEKLIQEFETNSIPYNDQLLKTAHKTHPVTKTIHKLLKVLIYPLNSHYYGELFFALNTLNDCTPQEKAMLQKIQEELGRCRNIESFVYPSPKDHWLEHHPHLNQTEKDLLLHYRSQLQRWLALVFSPIDQVIISFASEVFDEPQHLAMAHKLAYHLRLNQKQLPQSDGSLLLEAFDELTKNKEFLSLFDNQQGFDPSQHPGKVVISTIHKAKGLEWDRVYVLSINHYDFPSGMETDIYRSEIWFLKDHPNPAEEALDALEFLLTSNEYTHKENAKLEARYEVIRERLRVLYVAITRTKKELILTWNTGKNRNLQAAEPLKALYEYWENAKTAHS